MEHNVVTLETALKLKAAGFCNEINHYGWYKTDGVIQALPKFLFKAEGYQWSWPWHQIVFLCDTYTAQEIADQLPAIELHHAYNSDGFKWFAFEAKDDDDWGERSEADTMVEALAALWLKLKEVGNA